LDARIAYHVDVSGVPGTGKTATVLECVAALQRSRSATFDFVEINGMKLSDPGQVYGVLWRALSGKQASPKAALAHLQAYFKDAPRPTVVLLDELDTLLRKRHSILYHFFEWTGWKHAQLVIVTISNTMDLPERYLSNRIASRMGLNRVNFKPYSFKQLQDVIRYRMPEQSSWFTVDAIEIIGRKVSSVSGDARRALAAARRAVDFVVAQWKTEGRAGAPGPGSINFQVMVQVIDGGSTGSPYASMKALSALQMALLEVIVLAGKHQQRLSDTLFDAICTRFWQHCRTQAVPEPALRVISEAVTRLGLAGLVRVESNGPLHTESRVVSLVTDDDIAAVRPAKA
jgi:origin recognition complex subunit 1